VFACALYSLAVEWFFVTGGLAYGGLTGIAILLNRLFPLLSVGVLFLLLNVPGFLLSLRRLGGSFLFRSLVASALISLFMDLTERFLVLPKLDSLLSCIYGGLALGLSMGGIFLNGASTGGTDIIVRLIKLKLPWIPSAKLVLLRALIIISVSALVFGNLSSALYGLVALYVNAQVIDAVIYGLDRAKFAYIISGRAEAIAQAITRKLDRGATLLQGTGAFSNADRTVLLCAFRRNQIISLKREVQAIDPDAFIIVCDAYEVLGEGFRNRKREAL
jgi:uncharacterized membrane-anchored protein YitT (DUF2179 family)